jgi:hypothetical protein
MPYFTITDFAAGLDLRRSPLTAPPGTLRRLVNAHVTPGGEIEKRMAFVYLTTLDPNSRGLVELNQNLYAVRPDGTASITPPVGPFGVGYLNVFTSDTLTELFDFDVFQGKAYIIGYFEGAADPNKVQHFYNQVRVTAGAPGGYFCRTYKSKIYTLGEQYMRSSCVGRPDVWENRPEDPATPVEEKTAGYMVVDLSVMDSDMTSGRALEVYYNKMAVFSRFATQLWVLDPDPAKDQYDSTLRGAGTLAFRSVLQYGSGDIIYLAPDGIRSLRARNSSLAASVSDIGSPIDPLMQRLYYLQGEDWMKDAIAILQPLTGRIWMILPDRIMVLSAFPGPKISAWSEYRPRGDLPDGTPVSFTIVAAATHGDRIVVRDEMHRVWAYGGTDGPGVYDKTPVEVVFPFHAGENPATKKIFTGIDAAAEGDWDIYVSYQPSENSPDDDVLDLMGRISGPTFEQGRFPMEGYATHMSLRLRSPVDYLGNETWSGVLRLANMTIHYQLGEAS